MSANEIRVAMPNIPPWRRLQNSWPETVPNTQNLTPEQYQDVFESLRPQDPPSSELALEEAVKKQRLLKTLQYSRD